MKNLFNREHTIVIIIMLAILLSCTGIACAAEYTNTGEGKPRGMDIYIGDIPYSASLGGTDQISSQKSVGDFKVIVDDDNPSKSDPSWFDNLGVPVTTTPTSTPTPTPTTTPTPTATVVIPIDTGGIGAQLCVLDNTSDVIVDFAFSDAGYKNVFALSSPSSIPLGWSMGSGTSRTGSKFGTTWNLGKFTPGKELIFSDTANGHTYYTGPNSSNAGEDSLMHAAITLKNATGTYHKYLVTFEDWYGVRDNDFDYNDLEFYVSGNVSTSCITTTDDSSSDSDGSALSPILLDTCKCSSTNQQGTKLYQCVAYVTYTNTAGVDMKIPIKSSGKPWNEWTGSGMANWDRCQPTTFYSDPSKIKPFWTNPFWNNLQWKLGYVQSIQIKCERGTKDCSDKSVCIGCTS